MSQDQGKAIIADIGEKLHLHEGLIAAAKVEEIPDVFPNPEPSGRTICSETCKDTLPEVPFRH